MTMWGFANVSLFATNNTSTRPAAITFGCAADGKTAQQVYNEVLGSISGTTGLKKGLSGTAAFTKIKVRVGQDNNAPDQLYESPIAITGTKGGPCCPSSVALLVHKRTAVGGRRGRGRIFMPWGITANSVGENGLLIPSEVTGLQTTWTAWLADLATRGIAMFVLHQAGISPTTLPAAVTSLIVDPMVSSQRRRLGR